MFLEFEKYYLPGIPDGMTIDDEDNLYVASSGGSRVSDVKFIPTATDLQIGK